MNTLNNYLETKFKASEKSMADYLNRIKQLIKINATMTDEMNSLRNRLESAEMNMSVAEARSQVNCIIFSFVALADLDFISCVQATERFLINLKVKSLEQLATISNLNGQIRAIKNENYTYEPNERENADVNN